MNHQCPYCSYSRSWVIRREKRKCKKCRREFSSQKYPVTRIRSTLKEWKQCIHVFLRQRAGLTVSNETGIPHCRVTAMIRLLRELMCQDDPGFFVGPIEMDETYIGGQRKNKHLHIRRIKSRKGHGTEKLPIVGIFDRYSGQVYAEVLEKKLSIDHIIRVLHNHAVRGTMIYTDGFNMYRILWTERFLHAYVNHDAGEYVRGQVHTNNIEGFWGILKRKMSCIGGMRRERLHLFVAEIVWKFNHRSFSLAEQEELLLQLVIKFGGRS
jgi:transposase-like protein